MNPINMHVKVRNKPKVMALDCKRFYFPAEIDCRCPECGEPVKIEFSDSDDYLSYPNVNTTFHHGAVCPNEHEFTIELKLTVKLEKA